MKIIIPLVLAVVLLLWRFPVEVGKEPRAPADTERFEIVRVLDGDTAELIGGERVRLLGIDTPERGEPFADEARYLLDQMVRGRSTRLVFDHHRRDKYGRLLGFVYVTPEHKAGLQSEQEVLVNTMLVDSGLAYVYLTNERDLEQTEYRELLEAQRRAMGARLGLWGMTRSTEADYFAIKGSFRLHRAGCKRIAEHEPEKLIRFEDRLDGYREGLSPCRECHP